MKNSISLLSIFTIAFLQASIISTTDAHDVWRSSKRQNYLNPREKYYRERQRDKYKPPTQPREIIEIEVCNGKRRVTNGEVSNLLESRLGQVTGLLEKCEQDLDKFDFETGSRTQNKDWDCLEDIKILENDLKRKDQNCSHHIKLASLECEQDKKISKGQGDKDTLISNNKNKKYLNKIEALERENKKLKEEIASLKTRVTGKVLECESKIIKEKKTCKKKRSADLRKYENEIDLMKITTRQNIVKDYQSKLDTTKKTAHEQCETKEKKSETSLRLDLEDKCEEQKVKIIQEKNTLLQTCQREKQKCIKGKKLCVDSESETKTTEKLNQKCEKEIENAKDECANAKEIIAQELEICKTEKTAAALDVKTCKTEKQVVEMEIESLKQEKADCKSQQETSKGNDDELENAMSILNNTKAELAICENDLNVCEDQVVNINATREVCYEEVINCEEEKKKL
eukprot:Pgem_evm1s14979